MTVYVRLLEEAVDVWAPVEAEPVADDIYLLLGPTREADVLEFKLGEKVFCRMREFSDGMGLAAYARVTY